MFDGVARGYDRTNAVLSVGNAGLWRAATGRAVDPQPGERILDIAAGTGTSAAALSKSGAKVIALDFSQGMVEEGRRRHPGLEFVQGDAEKLPFGDDEFDAVTISFGSIKDWPDQTRLSQWLRGAGFTRVAYRNLTTGVVALHRGRKPANAAIRASVAQRRARSTESSTSTDAAVSSSFTAL